ncbi:ABC transporter substrate-binding protein [Aeromicrobium sp. CTD01-1L150]|uniref:ABC transporter substrate-binding protein n=1 Tax=Aeromicrobium sp. CTD01-1L150 TaxID=3341830 RepID=UPI0035C18294
MEAGIVNSATDALLFIADEKGYFKEEGLDVDFTQFDSAAKMIAPLGSGQLDVGAGAPSAGFYNAVARDIDVRIVADKGSLVENYDYMPILVRTDLVESGQVESVADLKGLRVAEPAEGTSTSATMAAVLESEGLDYDDVDHQFVGFPEHVSSFENGAIDAAATTEPTAATIVESGAAVRFFDSTEVYDGQQLAVILYGGGFSSDRPAVAQCFMNAYVKASQDYNAAVADGDWEGEESTEIVDIISSAIGIDPELFRKTVPSFVAPDGAVNLESLERDYEFFKERGWLEADVEADFDQLVDQTYTDQAAQSVNGS